MTTISLSPTRSFKDSRGYGYVETSEQWKEACAALPCFAALAWPDYATKVVEDEIDGEPVVIQLWKGWCQQFAGLREMPGGTGAEVGVYHRVPGRTLAPPSSFPEPLRGVATAISVAIKGLNDSQLWWPFPEIGAELAFELINPLTKGTFFSMPREKTYWLNGWMDDESYARYKSAQPWSLGPPPGYQVPYAWDYTLVYSINGRTRPAWTGHG